MTVVRSADSASGSLHRLQPGDLIPKIRRELCRRSAIEPINGLTKSNGPARAQSPSRRRQRCGQRNPRGSRAQHAPPDRVSHRPLAFPDHGVALSSAAAIAHGVGF